MRFLTLALVFLLSVPAAASHVSGGEITWKRIAQGPDQGKFIFTLVVYYDCNGIQGPTSGVLQVYGQNAPISTIPVSLDHAVDLTPDCLISAGNATPCNVSGPYSSGRFQAYYYTSNPVQLIGNPPPSGWHFSWSSCCYSPAIVNVNGTPSITIVASMFPDGTPFTPQEDSSPLFGVLPTMVGTPATPTTLFNMGLDPDGDVVVAELTNPLDGSGWPAPPISFNTGYAAATPFGNSTPTYLNPSNGNIQLNSGSNGLFLYAVKLTSYRNGVKLASVTRTVVAAFVPPVDPPLTSPTTLNVVSLPGGVPLTPVSSDTLKTTLAPGDSLLLRMTGTNLTILPSGPVTLRPYFWGPMVDEDSTYFSGYGVVKPATIYPTPPATGMNQVLGSSIDFLWTYTGDSCPQLPPFPNGTDPIYLEMGYLVGSCISPEVTRKVIQIYPDSNSVFQAAPVSNLQAVSTWNTKTISWSPPTDTTYGFKGYRVSIYDSLQPATVVYGVSGFYDTIFQVPSQLITLNYNRYSVQVVPDCGAISTSDTLALKPLGVDDALLPLEVYPNPSATGVVRMWLHQPIDVRVCDLSGKQLEVYSGKRGENQWDLHHLPAGVYILSTQQHRAIRWVKL